MGDSERPSWWSYPERCSHGHDWGPGRVIVSWMPCDCPAATASGASGAGHLRVSCHTPGCGSVWYSPRHEWESLPVARTAVWVQRLALLVGRATVGAPNERL